MSKQTIGKKPQEIMDSADKHTEKIPGTKESLPKSIRASLTKIIEHQREVEEKNEEEKSNPQYKFLNALMKPYSDLDPRDRLELYENEAITKRNIILAYQWKRMDTLWFQENKRSHPYMKKPFNDKEIEADLKILMDELNISQQQQQQPGRNISNGSAHLFRLQNQS